MEELAELMREDSDTEDAAPGPALPSSPSPSGPLTGGSLTMSRTNDMRQACRLGILFGLAPYTVKELEDFATENQNQRALLSQAKLLVIEAKIALLVAPAGTYEVPTPLMVRISLFTQVCCSP